MRRRRLVHGATALALLGAVAGLYATRRLFIRSWFASGAPAALPCDAGAGARRPAAVATPAPGAPTGRPAVAAPGEPRGRAPLRPVRVLLVDGLSRAVADTLPALGALCREGTTLDVDSGFPSVSLPVQHALWTGTWQTQSGVQFAVKRLPRPAYPTLQDRLRAAGGTSVALAPAHREIVASFPFTRVVAPREEDQRWSTAALAERAMQAARSPAELVFVHVLATDHAGHHGGADGAAYRAAARAADALLAALLAARAADWTVVALSDHGHLPEGGHGGREEQVRWTRACIAGTGVPRGPRARAAVIDLSRIIADQLGVAPAACGEGRALAAVLAARRVPPQPPAPRTLTDRWLLVVGIAVLALIWGAAARHRGPRALVAALPWWGLPAVLVLVLAFGEPSLSRAYVYPALPKHGLWLPALLAALGAAAQAWVLRWCLRWPVLTLSASAVALGGAALGATGWPGRQPPLTPVVTAWASVSLALVAAALAGLALAEIVRAAWPRRINARGAGGSPPGDRPAAASGD